MDEIKTKSWYKSITLWTNVVAIGAIFAQEYFGVSLSSAEEGSILAVINIILRIFVTKSALTLRSK